MLPGDPPLLPVPQRWEWPQHSSWAGCGARSRSAPARITGAFSAVSPWSCKELSSDCRRDPDPSATQDQAASGTSS